MREEAERRAEGEWSTYRNDSSQSDPGSTDGSRVQASREWAYHERGDRRGTWSRFRRMIYVQPRWKEGQRKLSFARKDTVIYTNLGRGGPIDRRIKEVGKSSLIQTENVIETHHGRGRDELVHRAIKDSPAERMPFEDFFQNMAFYSMMLLSFNLYEAFKEDVFGAEETEESEARIPLSSYATRLRREVIDIAGKLIKTGRQTVLKVTEATLPTAVGINLGKLFRQVADPPRFAWR